MKTFNKLVRDRIPKIIEASGRKASTHILSEEDYLEELDRKLLEECREYEEARNAEELADLYEVLLAIADARHFDLEETRRKKAEERGGFKERIYLESVED